MNVDFVTIDQIYDNVNIITETVDMNIGETTAVMFTRYHINSPTQSDPTATHGSSDFYIDPLLSSLARGSPKTIPETIATPPMVVIVVIMLPDATNYAISHDFITVQNKSNFPIIMNVVYVMTIDAIYDNVNNITVTVK